MSDIIKGIAPQVDTHANWVSNNPTLGKDSGGKSYGQIILSTSSPVGDIMVWGNAQTYTAAYAAGQYSVISGGGDPVGMIREYAADSAPTGYLACDGSAVSRTTYSILHALLKDVGGTDNYAWGNGDGSTTFNVPDLRGVFLRGAGTNGTLQDAAGSYFAGGSVGDTENDKTQAWQLGTNVSGTDYFGRGSGIGQAAQTTGAAGNTVPQMATGVQGDSAMLTAFSDGTNGTPRTGNETQPVNATILYCIKY